jgi:hypothetical protein
LPGVAISINGTSSVDQFLQFDTRPGQNITLLVNVTTEPKTLPMTLSASPKLGFPKADGVNWQLSSNQINSTSSVVLLHISIGNNVRPAKYPMEIDVNTQAISNVNFTEVDYFTLAVVSPNYNTAQKLMERGWTNNPTGVSALANPPVGIYNLTLSTNPIILGIPFYINAVVVNHQTEPITYYGGCMSPLSVFFDSIKTSTGNAHCLAISKYTLEPNQSVPVQSDKIETVYNATGPNATTVAQIKFSYEADGKPASMFTSMQIPIQTAIMIDCSTMVQPHISQIDKTVNVTKAITLAYTSPEFAAKVKQYGNVSYNYFYNDWFSSESCHTYWNGTEIMFTTNDKNGSRNIQVSEDINLTKVLNVKDFQVGLRK